MHGASRNPSRAHVGHKRLCQRASLQKISPLFTPATPDDAPALSPHRLVGLQALSSPPVPPQPPPPPPPAPPPASPTLTTCRGDVQ